MQYDISVVILTYNQEKYVMQTLRSIINQKTCYSFEVIVADDCSSDGTPDIIRKVADKNDNVYPIFNKHNMGLIDNYCSALKSCHGKYIMICGGDDCWLPGKIDKQMECMLANDDVGMSYGLAYIIDENGEKLSGIIGSPRCTSYHGLIRGNSICASTACFKESLWKQYINEIGDHIKEWKMEDYPFWLWISKNSRIRFIEEGLTCYRIVNGSISHQVSKYRQIEFENSVYAVKTYFAEENDRELLRKDYIDNIAHINYCFRDMKGYRAMLRKRNDLVGTMRLMISYIPLYFQIRDARRKLLGTIRGE